MDTILPSAPLTKACLTIAVALTVLRSFNILDRIDLFFSPKLIVENNELHRLITSLLFFGGFHLKTFLNLYSFANFASILETQLFNGHTADFLIFLAYSSVMCWISSLLTNEIFFGPNLVAIFFYYFSKHFSEQSFRVLGLPFDIKVAMVPFVYVGMALYQDGLKSLIPQITGIVIGHIYYFFHDVMAARFGTRLLEAPSWLKRICSFVTSQ
jgi:Derlin-2/3